LAVIYRSILDIADPDGGFVDRASSYFEEWIRMKLHDGSFELPHTGDVERLGEGVSISVARAAASGVSVFRGALFETNRGDGAELETQLIAIGQREGAIAWVDLDRTSLHATADSDWVPSAPNVVRRILAAEETYRGPTRLFADEVPCRRTRASRLAEEIVAPDREVTVVAIASAGGLDDDSDARARARACSLRLRGIAYITLVEPDACYELSARLTELLEEEMAIHPGDVHVFLPGVAARGFRSDRHRVIHSRELDGESEAFAALSLAPAVLSRAVEFAPPAIWRDRAKDLIDTAGSDETAIKIRRLIAHGESVDVEFKASLRYDIDKGGTNTELTRAITKTLAAFLNCRGGTLLIGVTDSGEPVGIARDLKTLQQKPNLDGFELCLREAVGMHLGNDVNPVVEISFGQLDGHTVAVASCTAHDQPVYHEDKNTVSFFVRAGNGTRPLNVREAVEYVGSRWPRTAHGDA
jgi:hypothetical protein